MTVSSMMHVSGECAMLIAACKNRWLDYEVVIPETLMSLLSLKNISYYNEKSPAYNTLDILVNTFNFLNIFYLNSS